jgi:hypothetical protein
LGLASPNQDIVSKLRNRQSLPPLTPERMWHPGLDALITAISPDELTGGRPDGLRSVQAWKASLHLWNDSLEPAHQLVQNLETTTGSALHGILHRRERDYGNAKYWFHRAGDHPAFHGLQVRVIEFLEEIRRTEGIPAGPAGAALQSMSGQGAWNSYLFCDAVEIVETRIGDDTARAVLETIQQLELEAVMRYLVPRLT